MKRRIVFCFPLVGILGQACTKGSSTSPNANTGANAQPTVSQAIGPMDADPVAIHAALAKLPPASDAKVAALTQNSAAALLLTQFSDTFATSEALSILGTDTDTNQVASSGLGLADVPTQPIQENGLSPVEKRNREAARFGNEFFVKERHTAIGKDSCAGVGFYFTKLIQANLNWKARAQGRLACIDAAKSPVFLQTCWGDSASTDAKTPYYLWTTLITNLDALITQLTDQQAKLQTLCTTYFAANPNDTWQWSDFQAALQQMKIATPSSGDGAVAANTDTTAAEDGTAAQVDTTSTLAAVREAVATNWGQLQVAKQAASACMTAALPPPPPGRHIAANVSKELQAFSQCMAAAQMRQGGISGDRR